MGVHGSLLYHRTVALTSPLCFPQGCHGWPHTCLTHKRSLSTPHFFSAVCWVPCKIGTSVYTCLYAYCKVTVVRRYDFDAQICGLGCLVGVQTKPQSVAEYI